MSASKIEWTDRSDWNPVRGCTRESPGCINCYAEAIAGRFSGPGLPFHGFATRTAKGARWTGEVEVLWSRFDLPLRWRKPARIFTNSTSDLFHERLLWLEIAELFGVMIAAHHVRGHTMQVLTKRADRMREALNREDFWEHANVEAERHVMEWTDPLNRRSDDARATLRDYGPDCPPPGIWLGVSTEDQSRAEERIPALLETPAAVRWISAEPLLEGLKLNELGVRHECTHENAYVEWDTNATVCTDCEEEPLLDWVVAGGESGVNARGSTEMVEAAMRSLRDQCRAASVPFFGKQGFRKQPLPDDLMVREFPA